MIRTLNYYGIPNYFEMVLRLNVKSRTIKIFEENRGEKFTISE